MSGRAVTRDERISKARETCGTVVTSTGIPLCWRCADVLPEYTLTENTDDDACINRCEL